MAAIFRNMRMVRSQKVRPVNLPQGMSTASIWVVWFFMAIGVLGGALFVLLDSFDAKKDAAAWVQAIGSVIAIVAAGAFPIWHDALRKKEQQNALRQLFFMLAKFQVSYLSKLHDVVVDAGRDFGHKSINGYLEEGNQFRWPWHIADLESLPLTAFNPRDFKHISNLKNGAAYAKLICDDLPHWNSFDERSARHAHALKTHLLMAKIIFDNIQDYKASY